MAYEGCRKTDMLGDVANAERTVQANNRDAKTIRVAEKAEDFCQLNRTFFLKVDRHSLASENISTGV
jgi:DNA-binding transcriptional regulator WhiA